MSLLNWFLEEKFCLKCGKSHKVCFLFPVNYCESCWKKKKKELRE